MSLLVHELLIGTGGGRGTGPNLKASSSSPVPIASIPVLPTNSSIHVTQLQQNRVVTITSAPSRNITTDKGSRLAEALAGNPPYSYSTNSYQLPQSCHLPQRQQVSHVISGNALSHSQLTQVQLIKSPSRPNYILPFVLQDHNYGAPPPPSTPPQSPPLPPLTVSSSIPYGYKIHQIISPSKGNGPISRNNTFAAFTTSPSKPVNQNRKPIGLSDQSIFTLNNISTAQITAVPVSDENIIENANPTVASHILAAMPLPRQQFMPHPKAPLFPSKHVSSNKTINMPNQGITLMGGVDTDEESRLSDQSSSAGPSGEETETAPEGEEEVVQADDSITRCICNFTHDDGYMIQCDRCFVWQHVDCMDIDRDNIPDEYLCEACLPRSTDRNKARGLQMKRRQEIRSHITRVSSSDSEDNVSSLKSKTSATAMKNQDRKVLKKKKSKLSKENKSNRRNSVNHLSKVVTPNSSMKQISTNAIINKVAVVEEKDSKPIVKQKRRHSLSVSNSLSGDDSSNTSLNLDQLRSWIEDYEIAVTNHYSQELRARVHSARINGISQEFRESTQGAMLGHRCRVAPSYDVRAETFEHKVLVATTRLATGTAIIEYQGKYALKSQWNPVQVPVGWSYLPFVLLYKMQKEGLNICVDARTYGNDARFARRSSQYNAEIYHVVERGSVHLYIVASKDIDEEEEIILPLETAICSSTTMNKIILQKNPVHIVDEEPIKETEIAKVEVVQSPLITSPIRKNGALQPKKCARKPLLALSIPQPSIRTSRRSTSGDTSTEETNSVVQIQIAQSPVKQRRSSGCGGAKSPSKSPIKSPSKSPVKNQISVVEESLNLESPQSESPGERNEGGHKMTREERKIAAYMKAFERMEKAAQRRQEIQKRKGDEKDRKQSEGLEEEEDGDDDETSKSADDNVKIEKGGKKGRKKTEGSLQKFGNHPYEDMMSDDYGSSSEGERIKANDMSMMGYSSPPSASGCQSSFRFPKTKKALMNEWLNETVDPVLHSTLGEIPSGVPTCYMRSPSTPSRKSSVVIGTSCLANITPGVDAGEMAGRSAKKRWLRQAIIDETEPQNGGFFCSSPNSRPDSPTSMDYITPLKKRRLARESMSSEQSNTPPSTPVYSSLEEEKFNEEMEIDHMPHESRETFEVKVEKDKYLDLEKDLDDDEECLKYKIKNVEYSENKSDAYECDVYSGKFKQEKTNSSEILVHDNNNVYDQLTINISQLGKTVKTEKDSETLSEINITSNRVYSKRKLEKSIDCVSSAISLPRKAKAKSAKGRCGILKTNRERSNLRSLSKSSKADTKSLSQLDYISRSKKNKNKKVVKSSNACRKKYNKKMVNSLDSGKRIKFKDKKKNITTANKEIHNNSNEIVPSRFSSQSSLCIQQNNNLTVGFSHDDNTINDLLSASNEISNGKSLLNSPIEKCDTKVTSLMSDTLSSVNEFDLKCSISKEHVLKSDLHVTFPDEPIVDSSANSNEHLGEESSTLLNVMDAPCSERDRVLPKQTTNEGRERESDSKEELFTEKPVKDTISDHSKVSLLSNLESCVPPIKKKLSILEYRKRKSISCERDSRIQDSSMPDDRPSFRSISLDDDCVTEKTPCKNISSTLPTLDEWDCDKELVGTQVYEFPIPTRTPTTFQDPSCSPPSPLSPEFLDGIKIFNSHEQKSPPKWNAAPTLLEQQRENLTARLRKNFGFRIPDRDKLDRFELGEKSIEEKVAEIEKRISLSEKLKNRATTLPLATPSFPKVSLTSALVSPLQSATHNSNIFETSMEPSDPIPKPLTISSEVETSDASKSFMLSERSNNDCCNESASALSLSNMTLIKQSSSESKVDSPKKHLSSNILNQTDL